MALDLPRDFDDIFLRANSKPENAQMDDETGAFVDNKPRPTKDQIKNYIVTRRMAGHYIDIEDREFDTFLKREIERIYNIGCSLESLTEDRRNVLFSKITPIVKNNFTERFAECQAVPVITDRHLDQMLSGFIHNKSIFNFTDETVHIRDYKGHIVSLRKDVKNPDNDEKVFIIEHSYHFRDIQTVKDFIENTQDCNSDVLVTDIELISLISALRDAVRNKNDKRSAFVSVKMRYSINIKDMQGNKRIYIPFSRDTLCLNRESLIRNTPELESTTTVAQAASFLAKSGFSGLIFEIVDNSSKISDRFISLGNKTIKVNTNRDLTKKSGIHYAYVADKYTRELGQIALEEDSKIGLYPNEEEATTMGSPDQAIKLRVAQIQRELQDKEQSLRAMEQQHRVEELNRKAVINQLEHQYRVEKIEMDNDKIKLQDQLTAKEKEIEQHRLERTILEERLRIEKQRRDDYYESISKQRADHYEEISHKRKDFTETLKWIPAIMSTVVAIVTVYKAIKTKTQ